MQRLPILLIALLVTGCQVIGIEGRPDSGSAVPYANMVGGAGAIVVGNVVSVSAYQQDAYSRYPWVCDQTDPECIVVAYFEVQVSITEVLATSGILTANPNQVITVLVHSARGDTLLTVGDNAIFFLRPTEVMWEGAQQPAGSTTVGRAEDGIFVRNAEGIYANPFSNEVPQLTLEQLRADIDLYR